MVPRPAMKIPKLVIEELNENVTSEGLEKNTLSPSIEMLDVPKKPGLHKLDPLHETIRSLYVIEVAVLEIGTLKS